MLFGPLHRLSQKLHFAPKPRDETERALEEKIAAGEGAFSRNDYLRGARLATECGEGGVSHFLGSVRYPLRNTEDYKPNVLEACLVALQSQGPTALHALGDVAQLLNHDIYNSGAGVAKVRARAAETLGIFGGFILNDEYIQFLPQLCGAARHLLDTRECNPDTAATRVRIFADLAELSIVRHAAPLDDFFTHNLGPLRKLAANSPSAKVHKLAEESLWRIRDIEVQTFYDRPVVFAARPPL